MLDLIPSIAYTGCGDTYLLSEHSGDGEGKIRIHSHLRFKASLRFTSSYLKHISKQQQQKKKVELVGRGFPHGVPSARGASGKAAEVVRQTMG